MKPLRDLKMDKYELRLEEQKELLKACQADKALQSCLNCEDIFKCTQRKDYVDAVYSSMNKGNTGGFDF